MTSVVVEGFGCRDARLTADAARTVAGTTTSRGVPSGTYLPSHTLQRLVSTHAAVEAVPAPGR